MVVDLIIGTGSIPRRKPIISAFQFAIMLQALCGYVMDSVGLKLGFAIFAIAWSFISMAHGFASSWRTLFGLRALLGLAEGSANPAGMKATSEWFPAHERGLAGGFFNMGASVGSGNMVVLVDTDAGITGVGQGGRRILSATSREASSARTRSIPR